MSPDQGNAKEDYVWDNLVWRRLSGSAIYGLPLNRYDARCSAMTWNVREKSVRSNVGHL